MPLKSQFMKFISVGKPFTYLKSIIRDAYFPTWTVRCFLNSIHSNRQHRWVLWAMTICSDVNSVAPTKNVVWTKEFCQISFSKIFILQESYEDFPLKFSDTSQQLAIKILLKFRREISTSSSENLNFKVWNVATFKFSNDVPHGIICNVRKRTNYSQRVLDVRCREVEIVTLSWID